MARWRITAIMAKASITMETWHCQPCQDLLSLWSSPNSFLATSTSKQCFNLCCRWAPGGEEGGRDRHRRYDDGSADRVSNGFSSIDPPTRSANSRWHHLCSRGPLVPAPADRRFQSDARRIRAMLAAVPATGRRLPQDRNTCVLLKPEELAFASATQLLFDVTDTVDRIAYNPLEWTGAAMMRAIILVASFGLVAKPVSAGKSRRSGSLVDSFGRYSARSMNA